jgi:hypothetical protein
MSQNFDAWHDDDAAGTVNASANRGPFHEDVRVIENVAPDSDLNGAESDPMSSRMAGASRPNYALVVAAGSALLIVLGAVGLFLKAQLFPSKSIDRNQDRVALEQPAPPPADPTPGVVSVLERPAEPAVSAVADATSQPKPAAIELPAAPAASRAVSSPAAPNTPPVSAAVASAAAPVKDAAKKPAKPEQIARAEPKKQPPSVARPKAESAAQEPVKPARAAQETIVLPDGLRVHAIYPLSGPDAQAWIREPSGRTTIVRVGEFLAGAQVTKILPERGEVFTTAGVLNSSGLR